MRSKPSNKLAVKQIVLATENAALNLVLVQIKMWCDWHHAIAPVAVAVPTKCARFKFGNIDKGIKGVKLINGPEATGAVQGARKMDRLTSTRPNASPERIP